MQEILNLLLQLKEYISADFFMESILKPAGIYAPYILALIVFAETGLMAGFFLPGDSLLFLAGMATAQGIIPMPIGTLMLLLIAAAIAGDQTGYLIGLKIGPKIFTREESVFFKPKYVQKTKEFYDRHGGKTIIIGRFVPFVRTFAPVIAGVAKLEYRLFVTYNVVGGILWIVSMLGLGYFIGVKIDRKYLSLVTMGIILVSLVPIITTFIQERFFRKNNQA